MKVCPICGKVIGYNSYFGAYVCDECEWEDDVYEQEDCSLLEETSEYENSDRTSNMLLTTSAK